MLLIKNIGTLVTMIDRANDPLGAMNNCAVLMDQEKILFCDHEKYLPQQRPKQIIDAEGSVVIPGLIDCHSHLVFAGNRADEFALRMKNESYEEILRKGGGINNTVAATRLLGDEELYAITKKRVDGVLSLGTTTIEAKSGYGLSLNDELRCLRILQRIDQEHPIDVHPTFMGAHVVPSELKANRNAYVSMIVEEMLETVVADNLALDCDVFCERSAFSLEEARKILLKANKLGLGLRAHVAQLTPGYGVELLNDLPLKSISHADFLSPKDIKIISRSKAVVEALPFAALFLRSCKTTPVADLKKEGVPLAIATDFNPGSAMCHDLIMAARLGVTYLGFTIEDALKGITTNAARSLRRHDRGFIKEQSLADIIVTNCKSVNEIFYDWTKHPCKIVIKAGRIFKNDQSGNLA